MRIFIQIIALTAVGLPAVADDGISKNQADQILGELRAIRQLLQRGNTVDDTSHVIRVGLRLEARRFLGKVEAPFTIVEFTDYQCPYCQKFHNSTFQDIKAQLIQTGTVRFYSRDLPLDIHKNARGAAQAARCAEEQGKYWEMRDVLQSNSEKLELPDLETYARQLNLDTSAFGTCLSTEKYKSAVNADVAEAARVGANGTPSFIIGKSTTDGVEGELVIGAMPYAFYEQKIKDLKTGK